MKRILSFALAAIVAIAAFRAISEPECPPNQAPTVAQRVLRFVAGWWIAGRILPRDTEPEQVQALIRDVPTHIANQRAMRAVGTDGTPLLDHSSGW